MRKKCQLSACAIMKNEGPYLEEWLEFHKIVGVERFYLYDNNSTDNTVEIVRPYLESGEVIYHQWPYQAGQKPAYTHCLKNYNRESEWIAFIDLDEFLFPSKENDLKVVLSDFVKCPGVVVNWLVFGNSGREQKPLGLQIESYTKRAEISKYPGSRVIKSIVRPRHTFGPINPHAFRYSKGRPVSENKESLPMSSTKTRTHSVAKLRINHYITRSSEELRQKVMRGRAGSIKKKKEFDKLDAKQSVLNEVEDFTIQRFIPALKIALEKKKELRSQRPKIEKRSPISPPLEPVQSQGHLGQVAIDKKGLLLSGWASSLYFSSPDGFKLSVGGEELSEFELISDLASPKIQQIYPYLDRASKARFQLRVPLKQKQLQEYQNTLIVLTPLFCFSQYKGCLLLNVLNPAIPLPSDRSNQQATRKFSPTAFRWLGYLIQKVGISPTASLLDLGCEAAQIAYSLAYYLQPTGNYQGFDIADRGLGWAKKEIATRKPNFNFDGRNIYHPIYNPTGTLAPTDFTLPYPDGTFDCVCVRDLFTRWQSQEVYHYLKEISRVLKLGGRVLFACFMLNLESELAIEGGNSSQNLVGQLDNCFTVDLNLPEKSVGFKESLLLHWIDSLGFRVLDKSYGSWCGRVSCNYEDLLILEKKF